MRALVFGCLLVIVLSACGGSDGDEKPDAASSASSEPSSSPTPSVTPNAPYGSVTDLRDAMIELGYPCPKWKQDNKLTFASSSGHWSNADVFSVYLDQADLKSQIEGLRDLGAFDPDFGGPMLAGPNWLLNVEDVEEWRAKIGGTVIAN